ncbi:trifunctional serine/threonine-protein kinase/ATP-binding protein/sensor histidine kinase [Stigmatella erecta]|uniref:histidine kinase n=1 Tax=Stigmatella erecta TaxID=83460 RepID=A0A1I0EL19_9BACT|nr:trifunctional serine/threonine-protein kinase/ATP-binding protein/sensor histidine kinase [Stigmatella erecta]SET45387.1 Predicted ATPase [Stigmatella erecta]
MFSLPGYTLLGAHKSSPTHLLLRAVRDLDGLRLILKTPVAAALGPRERERYRREFSILQRIRDMPGVPHVYGCEQLPDRPVLLLEDVEGQRLSELTAEPLEVGRVLELGISLSSTLAELHRRGIIHKDVKPANIYLAASGETRLIDFGSASFQRVEHVDALLWPHIEGSLEYMSPEQTGRMNRPVDYRTDLYSLGITLYELLTGSLPFHGKDALEWFHAHMAQAPVPPLERVPGLPPVPSAIILKLLAKVAEERYQSAEGLRADLARCRENLRRGVHEEFLPGLQDYSPRFQLPQRLYGRDLPAAALRQALERVSLEGRPELVLVRGYSGIGKSAVVHELHKPVVRQRGLFLHGKFDQFQRDIPYAPLAQAIRGLTQQQLSSTDAELARWREHLLKAWEGEGQVLVDVVPQLELVAGKQPPVPELPAAEALHRFSRVFRRFLGVFATFEHPLVLFLDDLQWADLASLQLLQHLLTHPETPPVLLIGTYRDNEVSPVHPLALMLAELRKTGARMTDLQLEPLSLDDIQRLVADTLPGAGAEIREPLSVLALQKTGGNPFFLLQFLRTLNQDGLLVRTPEGSWRWDAEGVRARGYSDNAVDFMVGTLRQLPAATRHLLRLAACVGNAFPLRILLLLSHREDAAEVEQELEPALQEGLVASSGPEQYRFLHDRIQQAAHALIPEQERQAIHLRIGQLLLASLSPEELQENLFDVVSQLNAGASLLSSPTERHQAARLNREAGTRARAATAFRSAAHYFAMAFQLLPGDPWEVDPELAFQLLLEQARCEFMSGNPGQTHQLLEILQPRAHGRANLATIYRLRSDLLLARGDFQGSFSVLLEGLSLVGMPLPPNPSWEEVLEAQQEVQDLLGERPIASLAGLPRLAEPDMEAVLLLLSELYGSTLVVSPHLLILHLCKLVSLSLRHGNSPASVHAYGNYGVILGGAFQRYHEGYAFGQLARELSERYGSPALKGRALYCLGLLSGWTQPLASSLEAMRQAFQHALQAGDIPIAGFCCPFLVMNRLNLGHALEEVEQEAVVRMDFVRKAGFVVVKDILLFLQGYVRQLRGLSPVFGSLSGDSFNEESFEAGLAFKRSSFIQCWYWLMRMKAHYLSGGFEQARESGERCAALSWSLMGRSLFAEFTFFRALSLAACFERMPPGAQAPALEALRQAQRQFAQWEGNCPENFRAQERILSAELARLTGRQWEALHACEEAIPWARQQGLPQLVGLACELAARLGRARLPLLADAYARQAREAYLGWGALGKVRHLEGQWPGLASATAALESIPGTDSAQLDVLSVVKAQHAISGEIVLDRLADTLLKVAIENAGAQRGALVLLQGGKLSVVADSAALPEPSGADGNEASLPWTLIAYVRRTREHVLLDDATQPHAFLEEGWLARTRARSVLCLPLVRQEEFRGVLYLENSLATHAFTPARLALLGYLASQAAISIENARLYAEVQRAETALRRANDELEKRVEERTGELRKAQAQLLETARSAGMAEVATSVLHNVGNVLTSAIINVEVLHQTVNASRVGRVKQVSTMLQEHQSALADFLTRDSRGTRLPGYLASLANELLREQATLQEGLAGMTKHIEHVRAVVHLQQTFARSTLLIEEWDLSQLVEDALSIQMPALKSHGVSVTRQLASLPKVRVDKHKVLQILINLINNAKDAMAALPGDRRHLLVRLEAKEPMARIQVVDQGVGIAPELHAQLFSQGFTTREGGHGLGLHSSALAARMLGGRLLLESDGPGQGATATLELPLV